MKKILIVDDSKDIRTILIEMIKELTNNKQKVKIFEAENGEKALRYLKHFKPDLMTLDLRIPGVHGENVLKKSMLQYHIFPVIVITGTDTKTEDFCNAEKELTHNYLASVSTIKKPFNLDYLKKVIQNILGIK